MPRAIRNSAACLLGAAMLALWVPLPAPAAVIRTSVAFPEGATRAMTTGRIAGRASNDHVVRARAGQVLAVRMDADSTMAYFNVLPPGSDQAVFIGSTSGNEFRGVLASDGDYVIRVYLMAAGARRGESSNYALRVDLTDAPAAPFPRSNDTR
jgi:hypothetical protein